MSARPIPKIPAETQIRFALFTARLGGCDCAPEIEIKELSASVYYAEVRHDGRCSHPSQQKGRDA